jgi:hypothetical protein
MNFLKVLVKLGIHGKRHNKSFVFVNVERYTAKKEKREKDLIAFMNDNGIGALRIVDCENESEEEKCIP